MVIGKKQGLVFLFLLLLFIPLVSAIKPTQSNVNGLQVFSPQGEYFKQNKDFTLHIHVSNLSDGLPLVNTEADCFLHLYNTSGKHTFEAQMGLDGNGMEWDLMIEGGNFSDVGLHVFFIYCNATGVGGEARGSFEVTPTGLEPTTSRAIMYGILMFILVGLFIFVLYLSGSMEKYKTNAEGEIIGINMLKNMKFVWFGISYALLMGIFFIASNIGYAYLGEQLFADFFFALFTIMMRMFIPIIVILVVWLIAQVVQDKKITAMYERGIPFNESDAGGIFR